VHWAAGGQLFGCWLPALATFSFVQLMQQLPDKLKLLAWHGQLHG
jgi:hypothetical protein